MTSRDRIGPRPEWLKIRLPQDESFITTRRIVTGNRLNTVCEGARCPNISECWAAGTATFMILGEVCTRGCRFCAVDTGEPPKPDLSEPERVASAVALMNLDHAVVTSVTRDDLEDGGASVFAETVREVRKKCPKATIELLIPDMLGSRSSLDTVCDQRPDVLDHNVETVPRLYATVRPQADYRRSLEVVEHAKRCGLTTKSGMMLGLGETEKEVIDVMADLREVGCDIVTLGQYLQPTKNHLPVQRWVTPEEFWRYRKKASGLGFTHCESGPLIRSSYHAERAVPTNAG